MNNIQASRVKLGDTLRIPGYDAHKKMEEAITKDEIEIKQAVLEKVKELL